MSKLFGSIVNLRVGTKLAVTSGLGIALLAAVLVVQMMGNTSLDQSFRQVENQETIAQMATEAKAAARALTISGRDMRLARSLDALQKAQTSVAERQKSLSDLAGTVSKLVTSQANKNRAQKVVDLNNQYVVALTEVAELKSKSFEVGRAGGADEHGQVALLDEQVAKIGREKTVPISAELDEVANAIVVAAKDHAARETAAAAALMSSVQNISLGIGVGAA